MSQLGTKVRRLIPVTAVLIGLLAGARGAAAQALFMDDITVRNDASIQTQKVMGTWPWTCQGFSISISYDPAVYEVLDVLWQGTAIETLMGPGGPDFWEPEVYAGEGGIGLGCVLSFIGAKVLAPAPTPEALVAITFRIKDAARPLGMTVPSMSIENEAHGLPPVSNVLVSGGASHFFENTVPIMLDVIGGTPGDDDEEEPEPDPVPAPDPVAPEDEPERCSQSGGASDPRGLAGAAVLLLAALRRALRPTS